MATQSSAPKPPMQSDNIAEVISVPITENHATDLSSDEESQPTDSSEPNLKQSWREIFMLTFTSLGAIYGDIGTSPLYVLNTIDYATKEPTKDDIYGGVSVVFYLFIFLVMIKYCLIVLTIGPNNGEGGQVAIYARIARHLNIGPQGVIIPGSSEKTDLELLQRQETNQSFISHYSLLETTRTFKKNPKVLNFVSHFILLSCFLGCSLVFSDGLLTPTTSILSAVAGIQISKPSFSSVLAVSEVIIIFLFFIQQYGSHRVSFMFAPVISCWLLGLIICGIYNIVKYDPGVFRALSPYYAVTLLKKGGIDVFSGAMLAITGTEAMFADLGHFGKLPVQIGISMVFVSLMCCYLGQAAYIIHHPSALISPFFYSIPGGVNGWCYWIMFVLATLSTIIASQALILGVFSIVGQLINLDCFPKFKITHVSEKYSGKVYIPLVNFMLLIGVCATAAGFKNSNNVTAAYGLGIALDFVVTTLLILIAMVYVYEFNLLIPLLFAAVFLPLEIIMVVSNLKKVPHGAWFPLMMTAISFSFLSFWRYGRSKVVEQKFASKVRIDDIYPEFKRRIPALETVDLGSKSKDVRDADEINNQREDGEQNFESCDEIYEFGISLPQVLKETETKGDMVINSRFGKSALKTHEGVAILHTEGTKQTLGSPNTVPQLYERLVTNFPSIPSVVIFCSTRTLSIPFVPDEERVLVGSMKIRGHYKCIVRFGFMEEIIIDEALNNHILNSIPEVSQWMINNSQTQRNGVSNKISIPTIHIFENNLIKAHDFSSEKYASKNPFKICQKFLRKFMIDRLYAPLEAIFQVGEEILDIKDEVEEASNKIFIGGVVRI